MVELEGFKRSFNRGLGYLEDEDGEGRKRKVKMSVNDDFRIRRVNGIRGWVNKWVGPTKT